MHRRSPRSDRSWVQYPGDLAAVTRWNREPIGSTSPDRGFEVAGTPHLQPTSMTSLLVLAAGLLWAAVTLAEGGDPQAGKARYAPCQGCHGIGGEGNKLLNAPPLAGQDGWYLARQIRYFKEGIRGYDPSDALGMQMRGMAQLMTDDQVIADVIAYLATLDAKASEATLAADAERGAELFAVCAQCHGPRGEGRRAMSAPRIAGLPDWYVVRQLQSFAKRTRGDHLKDPYGAQMRPMVRAILSDPADEQPLAAVASHLNTLR